MHHSHSIWLLLHICMSKHVPHSLLCAQLVWHHVWMTIKLSIYGPLIVDIHVMWNTSSSYTHEPTCSSLSLPRILSITYIDNLIGPYIDNLTAIRCSITLYMIYYYIIYDLLQYAALQYAAVSHYIWFTTTSHMYERICPSLSLLRTLSLTSRVDSYYIIYIWTSNSSYTYNTNY